MYFKSIHSYFPEILLTLTLLILVEPTKAGVFEFAGDTYGVDVITHPTGYDGTGGKLIITVGISPFFPHVDKMEIPLQNAINIWNQLVPTTGNVITSGNSIPDNHFDFESVALHELGHCIGLSHPNLASESGLAGDNKNYTTSTKGANNVFDLNSGTDGIIGSSDDIRGDDVNLHWFSKGINDPFRLPIIVDKTTYSQHFDDLPSGDHYVVNGDRNVSGLFGLEKTEAVMQQGIQAGESRRTLAADDVATLRLGMSGLDMLAGTRDDYTVLLQYAGVTEDADIVLAFDNKASFSACEVTAQYISDNESHIVINSGYISFNTDSLWFFNQELAVIESLLPEVSVIANGKPGSIKLNQSDELTLTVMLNPNKSAGNLADYWIKAITPVGVYWLNDQFQFVASDTPIRVFDGPLANIASFTLFESATLNLPPGTYIISFAVDDNMNNIYDATYEDSVIITIKR